MSLDIELPPQVDWEDVPRWYGLSYRPSTRTSPPTIVFLIRSGCAEVIERGIGNVLLYNEHAEKYGSLLFERDIRKGFGFDGVMRCKGEENGYLQLAMPLERTRAVALYTSSYSLLFAGLNYAPGVRADSDNARVQLLELKAYYNPERDMAAAPMDGEAGSEAFAFAQSPRSDARRVPVFQRLLSGRRGIKTKSLLLFFGLCGRKRQLLSEHLRQRLRRFNDGLVARRGWARP